jgi:hypothetical protein
MALLATETLGLEHGNALETDLVEGVLHLIELEGLDDRFDLLHLAWATPNADIGPADRGSPFESKKAEFMPDLSTTASREFDLTVTIHWADWRI